MGAVGFRGTKGTTDAETSKSFDDVVTEIARAGGIAIPAHVDGAGGLFELQGLTLANALASKDVFAMEVVDSARPKPPAYVDQGVGWTEVIGSDAHHPSATGPRYPGSHFTWVKMGIPDLKGLRLALSDGPLSVRRSDECGSDDLNRHPSLVLESIEISGARYMGRAAPLNVGLSPWLTSIVGGRGTGKSTLVEFLRLALRRDGELPQELRPEFEKYATPYSSREGPGLMTGDGIVRVIYRKDGGRFRLQWSTGSTLQPIEEESGGEWHSAAGEMTQRFPVRIYSQEQVFHMANAPLALLRIVDEADKVNRRSWDELWEREVTFFLSLRAQARQLSTELTQEPRLRGDLDDLRRKLSIFEEAGHSEVLTNFQSARRQQGAIEAWDNTWHGVGSQLRRIAEQIVPEPPEAPSGSEIDAGLHHAAEGVRSRLEEIAARVRDLAVQADSVVSDWAAAKEVSDWGRATRAAVAAYNVLREDLALEQVGSPDAYDDLFSRAQQIERRLTELDGVTAKLAAVTAKLAAVETEAQEHLRALGGLRRDLTDRRRRFLESVLEGNRYVEIQICPYGSRDTVEAEFRTLLQRAEGFDKDIGIPGESGLLGPLYAPGGQLEDIEHAVGIIKSTVREIAAHRHQPGDVRDQRFTSHVQRLPPEALDRFDTWFPEDSLEVRYSATGDGQNFRSISEGSPGQKTAALLAFLLSYGDEPLILNQPEDDLDNHLIYDLIVTQMRHAKQRRQIVVVTHNPNIVVNGDAELVIALTARAGQTHIECEGSLQQPDVRDTICDVMEGGRKAFDDRYRRIVLDQQRT